jgi:hypothetical protein
MPAIAGRGQTTGVHGHGGVTGSRGLQTKPTVEPMVADRYRCPNCGRGHMIIVERLEADPPPSPPTVAMSVPEDTS